MRARWAPYAPNRDLDVVGEVPLPQAEGGEPAEGRPEPGEVLRGRPAPAVVRIGAATCCVSRSHHYPTAYGYCSPTHSMYATRRLTTSGWHLCLNALAARLDGKDVEPVAGTAARNHGWEGLRDDYAVMLGN